MEKQETRPKEKSRPQNTTQTESKTDQNNKPILSLEYLELAYFFHPQSRFAEQIRATRGQKQQKS